MANNVKKLLQVSEEAAPLIQIPVMVGNEMFVLTQQDVRRTEDIRYLSYDRIAPNVHLFPTAAPAAAPVNYFGGLFTPLALPCTAPPNGPLQELFGRKKAEPAPGNVADVATQMAWSKEKEIEPSNRAPLRYSAATSTSSLTKSCACQHDPPKSRSQHTSCNSHTARNACVQTKGTTSSTASSTGSKSIWKTVASDMSVAESKSNVNISSPANLSDAGSKDNCNGSSEGSVPAKESKCPSRHCKSQQTCTYSDGQSYHRCSPREGRFRPQQHQSSRCAQYKSRGCAQDRIRAQSQEQLTAAQQDQRSYQRDKAKFSRSVYFSPLEDASSV
ncbi:uncharacterized protein Mst89B [Drosophila pseudoobscura]|uniref:Uncharacterized protein Mst89B n=1 Tax=Drosophila pseudoobscura pseudoobscura TaxID=46245 RepID=A0A6I8UR36_DROPS|nr:uncharacterized protein LOC4802571 [Drosophila pseudoobscura]